MSDITVNRFRTARGKVLSARLARLSEILGRKVRILDVGGRPDYWDNVGFENIDRITLLNYDPAEFEREKIEDSRFDKEIGDACDLDNYEDGSVDMVHSNSVIEHVGNWDRMAAMASEAMRVGLAGWIQTPAWEFPIEPHFKAPFMHWFGAPAQRAMFSLSFEPRIRRLDMDARRRETDAVNLLSRREVAQLFPGKDIYVERLFLAKSYSVNWLPDR